MSDITEEKSPETGENRPIETEEQPLVETSFHIDGAAQKLFQRKFRILSVVLVVVGAVLALAYIVLFTINGEALGDTVFSVPEPLLSVLLFLGAVPLGCGIVFLILMKKNVANADRTDAENHYRFFADHVLISVTQNGEDMGQVKCYYNTFVKVRENADYFMLYPTSSTVYLVSKSSLSEAARSTLHSILPLKK